MAHDEEQRMLMLRLSADDGALRLRLAESHELNAALASQNDACLRMLQRTLRR